MSESGVTSGQARELLPVSAAARLLGVSASSLRAWAAAGRVPHVRTRGGHRRFDLGELEAWLAERGGAPPAAPARAVELVPTRVEPLPDLGRLLRQRSDAALVAVEAEMGTLPRGSSSRRPAAARQARVADAVVALADALESGDLGASYREAEWQGFRHGAAGQPGEAPITEVLALRRAIDRTLGDELVGRPAAERRTLERALDRMAIRMANGYAEGLRARLRTAVG